MPSHFELLKAFVTKLEAAVQELGTSFPSPVVVDLGGDKVFRHAQQDDLLMSYLKCIRTVSTLNAALLLLQHGYVQEIGALCRCIQDFCEDVWFLSTPLGKNGPSDDQQRLVEEFFQEEFDQPLNPLASTQKRDRVPRKKLHAGIARIQEPANPSRAKEVHRTIQQVFSGYIHAAYVHIMEMYGGNPPRYHTRGMLGTRRIREWEEGMVNYVYRAIVAAEVVARRAGAVAPLGRLRKLRESFEAETGCAK